MHHCLVERWRYNLQDAPRARRTSTAGSRRPKPESVAYVGGGALGLKTSPTSISYISGWSDDNTERHPDTAWPMPLQAVRILSDGLIAERGEQSAAWPWIHSSAAWQP